MVVGTSPPRWDLVILTTNLSYGVRTCLGVGVLIPDDVPAAAAADGDWASDRESGFVARFLLLTAPLLTLDAITVRLQAILRSSARDSIELNIYPDQ